MIGEVSEFYKEMGFTRLYIVINKEPRRVAILYKDDGSSLTMSYAKYLYTSHYKELIDGHEYHIDHINNNKMDDRIENLQKITGSYNRSKNHCHREMVLLKCPVCGKEFIYPKANLYTHQTPCCSRKCGGIKSHWK